MRVLIIEDDAATARLIELHLRGQGMNPQSTDLGEEGLDLARIYDWDCITLDLGLPDMSGGDVLRRLRAAKIDTPVLIISGSTEIETKVRLLTAGADDYLAKPFHRDELAARVAALIRRSKGVASPIITVGDLRLDIVGKVLAIEGEGPVHLTGREYQLTELLMLRKGTTLTKEMMLNHLYGGMDEPELKIIDVFICKLRRKLGFHARHIETVWGRGYKVVETPTIEVVQPLETSRPHRQLRDIILEFASLGPFDFPSLRDTHPAQNSNSLRSTVTDLVSEKRLASRGRHRETVYEITKTGREWIESRAEKAVAA